MGRRRELNVGVTSLIRAYVGASTTITGTCTPGLTVVVTVGGAAFGSTSNTGSGAWSITAACPNTEGDNVAIVATAGGVSASGVIARVCVAQVATFMRNTGLTLRAGTYVTAWTSQTGGHVVAQASESLQPALASGVVAFDGLTDHNDYLIKTDVSAFGASVADFWVACAIRVDSTAGNHGIFSIGPFSNSHGEVDMLIASGRAYFRMLNNTKSFNVAGIATGTHVYVLQLTGGVMTGWIDGAQVGTVGSVGNLNFTSDKLVLGKYYDASAAVTESLRGGIHEAVVGTTLTTAQRQRLEAALAAVAAS